MILGFILVVLFGVLTVATADTEWDDIFTGLTVGSLLLALLISSGAVNTEGIYTYREKVISQEPIYSLETSSAVHGNFVLGTGEIESGAKYYFYTKDGYGGLKLVSVNSDSCSIVETDKQAPSIKLVQRIPVFKSGWYTFLFWPNLKALEPEKHYILYVPSNTIKKIYSGSISH